MGNLFASFIPEVIANQSNGVFILRIEDTDDKRAIDNGVELILEDLEHYNYNVNEHPLKGGEYGPYIQTERKDIYHIVRSQKYRGRAGQRAGSVRCFRQYNPRDRFLHPAPRA